MGAAGADLGAVVAQQPELVGGVEAEEVLAHAAGFDAVAAGEGSASRWICRNSMVKMGETAVPGDSVACSWSVIGFLSPCDRARGSAHQG